MGLIFVSNPDDSLGRDTCGSGWLGNGLRSPVRKLLSEGYAKTVNQRGGIMERPEGCRKRGACRWQAAKSLPILADAKKPAGEAGGRGYFGRLRL